MDAAPAPLRTSAAVIAGWWLTVPGFVMMALLLIVASGAPELAGCRFSVMTNATGCEETAPLMHRVVVAFQWSLVFTIKGIGLAFLAWSLIYPPVRWWLRLRAS
jgi:hypothetical protein